MSIRQAFVDRSWHHPCLDPSAETPDGIHVYTVSSFDPHLLAWWSLIKDSQCPDRDDMFGDDYPALDSTTCVEYPRKRKWFTFQSLQAGSAVV